jgi:hypothetical protein
MIKLSSYFKWVIPFLIITVLVLGGCKMATPTPATPPATEAPPPAAENHKPVINYITAQQQVSPSSSTRITCVATDADGDSLIYAWSAKDGKITGDGDTVTWIAPDAPGSYSVGVTVTDGKGGEARDSANIGVLIKPNHAPLVTVIVRQKGLPPITINQSTTPIKAKRWSTTEIECKSEDEDGDPISFRWSTSEGKIEGEGNIVQYIATTAGDYAVTVTAIDSKGAATKSTVYFHVPCCGQG